MNLINLSKIKISFHLGLWSLKLQSFIIFIIFWDLIDVLANFPFTTSETMGDYYL